MRAWTISGRARLTCLVVVAIAAINAACSSGPEPTGQIKGAETADEFVSVIRRNMAVQLFGLRDPATVLDKSSIAVKGSISGVRRGPSVVVPSDLPPCAVQIERAIEEGIEVESCEEPTKDETLYAFLSFDVIVSDSYKDGDSARVGKTLTFELMVPPIAVEEALNAAPGGEVIVLLGEDSSAKQHFPNSRIVWTDTTERSLVIPLPEGVWFHGSGSRPLNPFVDVEMLGSAWNSPETLNDIADAFE